MIQYMKNFDFVRVIENETECLLFNDYNMNSVIIKKEVYELLQDIRTLSDFDDIAKDFCENDQDFFKELRNVFVKRQILEKSGSSTDRFKRVNYIITDYCNLFCKHCCYAAKFLQADSSDNVIDKELKILDRIISLKPEVLTITGGEPLTIKNFDKVIEKVKSSNISQRILQTNGTLISEQNIDTLTECFNSFDISLDGSTPQETESLRGKGTYEKVMHAIELLKRNHVKNISISCAMNTDELDKRKCFEDLCEQLDVKAIVRQMSTTGRAKKQNFETKDRQDDYFYDMLGQYCSCTAGISEITVNNKGEVFPCLNFLEEPYIMGNIFDDNILSMLGWDKEHPWYQNFSEYVSVGRKECSECEINMLCWNCPFQVKNFVELHNVKSLASICENKKQAIYRRLWDAE